jgi:hypothetical protein
MSRRLPAWLRYWFPKPRPPILPGGVRGPYNPAKLTREDWLLMASRHAKTPQHGRRLVEQEKHRAAIIAQRSFIRPRGWKQKLKMLWWRFLGYARKRAGDRQARHRLTVTRKFRQE